MKYLRKKEYAISVKKHRSYLHYFSSNIRLDGRDYKYN